MIVFSRPVDLHFFLYDQSDTPTYPESACMCPENFLLKKNVAKFHVGMVLPPANGSRAQNIGAADKPTSQAQSLWVSWAILLTTQPGAITFGPSEIEKTIRQWIMDAPKKSNDHIAVELALFI